MKFFSILNLILSFAFLAIRIEAQILRSRGKGKGGKNNLPFCDEVPSSYPTESPTGVPSLEISETPSTAPSISQAPSSSGKGKGGKGKKGKKKGSKGGKGGKHKKKRGKGGKGSKGGKKRKCKERTPTVSPQPSRSPTPSQSPTSTSPKPTNSPVPSVTPSSNVDPIVAGSQQSSLVAKRNRNMSHKNECTMITLIFGLGAIMWIVL